MNQRKLSVLSGAKAKVGLQRKRNGVRREDAAYSPLDFNSEVYVLEEESHQGETMYDVMKGGNHMGNFASKAELDALKEMIKMTRESDQELNEERSRRLNDKIESSNQLLTQKIDSSNDLLVSRLDSVSRDIEHMTSTLSSKIETELDARFAAERKASEAETKETRKFLWTIWVAIAIGIAQIVITLLN